MTANGYKISFYGNESVLKFDSSDSFTSLTIIEFYTLKVNFIVAKTETLAEKEGIPSLLPFIQHTFVECPLWAKSSSNLRDYSG